MPKYYVYRHVRLDTNEVFYIGMAQKIQKYRPIKIESEYLRAYSFKSRSKEWFDIVDSTSYAIEILFESDDKKFMEEKEKEFIALYGRSFLNQGSLVNKSAGGTGSNTFKHTEEALAKIVKFKKTLDMTAGNNPAAQKVINTLTLEIFDSGTSAAIKEGYHPKNFRRWVSGQRKNPTYYLYLKDYKDGEVHYPEKQIRYNVKVIDNLTGEEYPSMRQASIMSSVSVDFVQKELDAENGRFRYKK